MHIPTYIHIYIDREIKEKLRIGSSYKLLLFIEIVLLDFNRRKQGKTKGVIAIK